MGGITILEIPLNYLRINCVWPSKETELQPKWTYYVKFLIIQISTLMLITGSFLHLIKSRIHKSSYNVSEDLVMIIAEFGGYYFLCCFVVYQKNLAKIYEELSDFSKYGKPPTFDEGYKRLKFLGRSYNAFINLAIAIFCLVPFWSKRECERINQIRSFKEVCGMMISTWMPFDFSSFPYKQLYFVWQIWSLVMTLKGSALVSFAIMETMEHLIIRLQHLKVMLTDCVKERDLQKRNKKFGTAIEYHIDILNMGKRVDSSYTNCLFLHIILTGALFGCIGYRFMESTSLNALSLFNGWMLSLIIVCVSGQRLLDEALSIGDIMYNSKWYNTDANFQKNITFIIERSQRPIVVHAGPFTYLSNIILLTIMKTAYSYMALLNTTNASK